MTTNQDQTIYVTENKQEFVPSVGQECILVSIGFCEYNEKVLVTYFGDGVGCYKRLRDGMEFTFSVRETVFKPLKTEAEIKAEKQIKEIWNDLEDFYDEADCPQPYDTAKYLQSKGYIKPREITTEATNNAAESFVKEKVGDVMDLMSLLSFAEGARWAEKHIKGEA